VRTRLVLVAASVAVLALALAGCSAPGWHSPRGLRVVAVGDSIMKGHGLRASDAWPVLLAHDQRWKLDNLACDGAGFLAVGDDSDCGTTFAGLVREAEAEHPEVVIVQGSSNDLGKKDADLEQETQKQLEQLHRALPHTEILGLSTIWNDTKPPAQIGTITTQVKGAVQAVGGQFIDIGQPLEGHRSWMQEDDVHPTRQGQVAIEGAVLTALENDDVKL
jgi:acyl-CoA thioesterase I